MRLQLRLESDAIVIENRHQITKIATPAQSQLTAATAARQCSRKHKGKICVLPKSSIFYTDIARSNILRFSAAIATIAAVAATTTRLSTTPPAQHQQQQRKRTSPVTAATTTIIRQGCGPDVVQMFFLNDENSVEKAFDVKFERRVAADLRATCEVK